MDDTRLESSRRRVLQCCALGSLTGLAGCLGPFGDDEPPEDDELPGLFDLAGDGTEQFVDWLAPESPHGNGEGQETLFIYQDFVEYAERGIEPMERYRRDQAAAFGTDPEIHEGELSVGIPGTDAVGRIYVGEFDVDAITEHLESQGGTVTDEYDGYTVFNDTIAVGDDALLVTPEYDSHIDAKNGDGPHLRDENAAAGLILALQPHGVQISATRRSDSNLEASGTTFFDLDGDGNPQRVIRTFVFESPEDASVEAAKEIAAGGRFDTTLTDEHHGRVVMLESEA